MIKKKLKNGQHPKVERKALIPERKPRRGCFRKFESVKELLEGLRK